MGKGTTNPVVGRYQAQPETGTSGNALGGDLWLLRPVYTVVYTISSKLRVANQPPTHTAHSTPVGDGAYLCWKV